MKRTFSFLLALTLVLSFSLVMVMPVAADPGTTYYISTTGSDVTGNGTEGNPWRTIQYAIGQISSGDNIMVAVGTYVEVGQIVIDKNITMIGEDRVTTIIKPAQNTSDSGDGRGWFLVNTGKTFNLSNVTLDGSGYKVYQAIRHKGSGTIANCKFNNIQYEPSGPTYYGQAMAILGNGNVNVTNCTFTAIGRVGVLYDGTGVTGSTFSNNTYTGKGTGNWLDYGVEVGAGATAIITGNTITNCRGVASSDGSTSSGILVTTYYGSGTTATITSNTLTGNSGGIIVGYDASDASTVVVHNNSIAGNINYGINTTAPAVNATLNWWGNASGPYHPTLNIGGAGDDVNNNVTFQPWLMKENGTETIQTDTEQGLDAAAITTNTSARATGGTMNTTVTVAEYAENPGGPTTGFSTLDKYMDVYVPDTTSVTGLEMRLYYTHAEVTAAGVTEEALRLFWWDGGDWVECSNSGVDIVLNYIWAIITNLTTPSLAQLNGTPFGGGEPPEVPTVTTKAATEVLAYHATLSMNYTVGGFNPVQVRFAYNKSTDTGWSYTDWVSKAVDGNYTVTITGLTSSTKYDFKAQLNYDDTVIEGVTLQFTTTIPPAPPSSPDCFIATAVYGTPTAEQIDVLREFRDVFLLESTVGSQFVTLYYQLSPPIANFIAGSSLLRALVRELLVDPIVWVVEATGDMWRN